MKSFNVSRVLIPALLASAASMAAGAANFNNVTAGAMSRPAALGESAANGPSADTALSPAQLARAQAKLARAVQIANQFAQSAAEDGVAEGWRAELVNTLMQMPEAGFAQVSEARDVRSALQAATAGNPNANGASQAKSLGDVGDDVTYIPLASPCRIVDTRSAGGPILAGTSRTFTDVSNTTSQGGAGCQPWTGFAGAAAAIATNVTVDATGSSAVNGSYLQLYANGASVPATSWMNFGGGQIIANSGVLPIDTGFKFVVFASGTTNVIVDVYGSFVRPAATPFQCVVVGASGSGASTVTAISLPASSNNYYATDSCPTGYTVTTPYCWSSNQANVYANGSGVTSGLSGTGGTAFCSWINLGGATPTNVFVGATCCRIPGR